MDADLEGLTRDELLAKLIELRNAVRAHRDATGQELCWHHPALWALLPEPSPVKPLVPDWPQFMRGCVRYRQSLDDQLPDAPRTRDEY